MDTKSLQNGDKMEQHLIRNIDDRVDTLDTAQSVEQTESIQNHEDHIDGVDGIGIIDNDDDDNLVLVQDDSALAVSRESEKALDVMERNMALTDPVVMDADTITETVEMDVSDDLDHQETERAVDVQRNGLNLEMKGQDVDEMKGHCSCGERGDPEKGTIACTFCNVSFHYKCVGLVEEVANKMDVYKCAGCRSRDALNGVSRVSQEKVPQLEAVQGPQSSMLFNGRL